MFPFKLETHTSVLVRLQGIRNVPFRRLFLKVIKGMKVIRGSYSSSPTVMFKIVSVSIQQHDDLTGIPRNRWHNPTAYCILSHCNKDPRNYLKNNREIIMHEEPNFGLQNKVLAPFLIWMLLSFINSLFVWCKLSDHMLTLETKSPNSKNIRKINILSFMQTVTL